MASQAHGTLFSKPGLVTLMTAEGPSGNTDDGRGSAPRQERIVSWAWDAIFYPVCSPFSVVRRVVPSVSAHGGGRPVEDDVNSSLS